MNYSDREIRQWAAMAQRRGGSFVKAIGDALVYADDSNFSLLRAVAVALLDKYPNYLRMAKDAKQKESA